MQVLSAWKCLRANVRAKDVSGQGCCRAEGTGGAAQDASHCARSLRRLLGAVTGRGAISLLPAAFPVTLPCRVTGPAARAEEHRALWPCLHRPRGACQALTCRAEPRRAPWLDREPMPGWGPSLCATEALHQLCAAALTFSLRHSICAGGWHLSPGSPSPLSCQRSSSEAAPAGRAPRAAAAQAAGLGMFSPVLEPILVSVLRDKAWLAWAARSHRGAVVSWWEEQGWKEPGFPSWEVSGLPFPGGVCRRDRMRQPAWKGGGTGRFWQCPSERPPGSLSARILASARGLDTVLEACCPGVLPAPPPPAEPGQAGSLLGQRCLQERCQDPCLVPVASKGTQRTVRGGGSWRQRRGMDEAVRQECSGSPHWG